MRILLTDGSGLTSRQVAGRLGAAGHTVGVLSPDPRGLARFTRSVRAVHPVPAYGLDPFAWFDAACEAMVSGGYDLLFPTQEQVAVLALMDRELEARGIATPVASFRAVAAVQDKVAARATLERLGLPQPNSEVLHTAAELVAIDVLPVFVKVPIGTATTGVHRVTDRPALEALADQLDRAGVFADGGVVAQNPVLGPLAMVQTVFDDGRLVAAHANLRVREGARGGASHKCSVELPEVIAALELLGRDLQWRGALSADAIVGPDGPVLIDINPRLVEPVNAWRSGVDLVGAMLEVAAGRSSERQPERQPPGRAGVHTHQLLLAVLGAAQDGRGRRGVIRELTDACRHRGTYAASTEELTPVRGDWRAAVPVAAAVAATMVKPSLWQELASGSVANYALTPEAWIALRARHAERT